MLETSIVSYAGVVTTNICPPVLALIPRICQCLIPRICRCLIPRICRCPIPRICRWYIVISYATWAFLAVSKMFLRSRPQPAVSLCVHEACLRATSFLAAFVGAVHAGFVLPQASLAMGFCNK